MNITITVHKDTNKGYGYNLRHNQPAGFKGIIGNTWAWYKLKRDAVSRAAELLKCWETLKLETA